MLETKVKENIKRKSDIQYTPFYAGTLRIIDAYVREFSKESPSESLRMFLERSGAHGNASSGQVTNASRQATNTPKQAGNLPNDKNTHLCNRNKYFLEEIRLLLLSTILCKEIGNRKIFRKMHTLVHLLELYFLNDRSEFEKINDFLNTNFKLHDDDMHGHLLRGNLGEVMRICPDLGDAIEELVVILKDSQTNGDSNAAAILKGSQTDADLMFRDRPANGSGLKGRFNEWRSRYKIDSKIFKIVTGGFQDFENSIEKYCYDLAYGVRGCGSEYSHPFLQILKGDFRPLLGSSSSWLKLIVLLALGNGSLVDYEYLFEELFFDVFALDYQIALDYLSYSRANELYFNLSINFIPLNCSIVESLIRFTRRNNIDNARLLRRYIEKLELNKDYDYLCRFILKNGIDSAGLSAEFARYFVGNYSNFGHLASEEWLKAPNNRVIQKLSEMATCEYSDYEMLVEHEYFDVFTERIIMGLLECRKVDDTLLVKFLSKLVNAFNLDGAKRGQRSDKRHGPSNPDRSEVADLMRYKILILEKMNREVLACLPS